jgi:hypothetical protein
MPDWKTLQDSNPEPSLLDAIAFAEHEKNKAIDKRINAMLAEHGIILPVPDMSPDMAVMPSLKGEDE